MAIPPLIHREVKEYAEKHRLSAADQEKLLAIVDKVYQKSTYDPEEPVGVVSAQSLSEPATQMTMRTYHFAGTAGIQVTLGLPRMIEIFDARKEPRTPTMTIYIENDYQSIEQVRKIAEQIKEVRLKDIMLSNVIDLTDMWIKCKLDPAKVKEFDIDVAAIPKRIKMRGAEASYESGNLMLKSKNTDIRALYKMKYAFLETHIKGIKGVSQVVVTKEEDEWVINTLGSNLKQVFEIEGVDYARSFCNNMFEMYEVLGIEAGRTAIINQAQYTMEEQGLGVDVRYIMLLADLMTVDGEIKAIGRYGISGQKASVLVRASFEETKKHLVSASVRGEKDLLKGAIENIILNQVAPIGTGAFDLVGRIPPGFEESEEEKEARKEAAAKKAEKEKEKKEKAAAPKEKEETEEDGGEKASRKKEGARAPSGEDSPSGKEAEKPRKAELKKEVGLPTSGQRARKKAKED